MDKAEGVIEKLSFPRVIHSYLLVHEAKLVFQDLGALPQLDRRPIFGLIAAH